jgi:hypothetical protein
LPLILLASCCLHSSLLSPIVSNCRLLTLLSSLVFA